MENNNEVVVYKANQVATPEQVRDNVNLIQKVMAGVMKRGTHYDTVPGCGPKPTLLKPGAEKLCATFLLAPDPEIQDLSTPDEIRYRIKCRLIHSPSGVFMGSGVGEASTNEEKFKWRKAVCQKEYDNTPEERRRIKYQSNGQEISQVRTNIADLANTVLKMCKKRALVDGTLTVTGASDMFTQDIEEMGEVLGNEPIPAPKQKEEHKAEEPKPDASGKLVATGLVTRESEPNAGGYIKFGIEGYKDGKYDIGFTTKNPDIIQVLRDHKIASEPVSVTYERKEWVKGEKSGYNYTIVGVSAATEKGDAQE